MLPCAAAAAATLLIACGDHVARQGNWGVAAGVPNSGTAADAFAPDAAIDARGNAVVVWYERAPAGGVLAARQTADGRWQEAVVLDSGPVGLPRIAMDASGNGAVVWPHYPTVWARRFSPVDGWTPAAPLTPPGDGAGDPRVALDPKGDGLAVWYSIDRLRGPNGLAVWAARLASGQWRPAEAIQSAAPEAGGNTDLAVSADGSGLAVWVELQGGAYRIWSNRFHPTSGWSAAEPISNDPAGGALFPDLAMNAAGGAMAVWRLHRSEPPGPDIVANRYQAGGGWGTPATVAAARSGEPFPQVAMDAAGNALVVWRDGNLERRAIWAARFAVGVGWGPPVLLGARVGGISGGHPRVAMDVEGNAIAAWRSFEADRLNVYAAEFNLRRGWQVAQVVGSGPSAGTNLDNLGPVALAVAPGGHAIVAWSQQDGGRHAIWANRFERSK
jgi:hypothetical protein